MAAVLPAAGLKELSLLGASSLATKGTAHLRRLTGLHQLSLCGSGGVICPQALQQDDGLDGDDRGFEGDVDNG
jgi:hypothetical protein